MSNNKIVELYNTIMQTTIKAKEELLMMQRKGVNPSENYINAFENSYQCGYVDALEHTLLEIENYLR